MANWAPREFCMFSQSFLDLSRREANRLAIVMIASGNPPHFFRISFETSSKLDGHLFSDPNTLPVNNFLESSAEGLHFVDVLIVIRTC